jgi:arylsulfatase A-like enzyme
MPFQKGIRSGKWKYIRMFDGKPGYDEADVDFSHRQPDFEVLFDLEADPQEMDNLAKSDDHRAVLATLRHQCAAHSQSLNEQRRAFRGTVQVQKR